MPLPDVRLPSPARRIDFETIGSTNAEALQRVATGERGPLWITAAEQTSGRGRGGRAWASARGNLYASLLLTVDRPPLVAAQLALVAGLAVQRTFTRLAPGLCFQLKWPNDVLAAGSRKISGILLESVAVPEGGLGVVLGLGLNLVTHPEAIERPATDLKALGVEAATDDALIVLAGELQQCLNTWREGAGFDAIRQDWLAASLPVGSRISVRSNGASEAGTFLGLDDDGAMIFAPAAGGSRRITFGDVSVPAGTDGAA